MAVDEFGYPIIEEKTVQKITPQLYEFGYPLQAQEQNTANESKPQVDEFGYPLQTSNAVDEFGYPIQNQTEESSFFDKLSYGFESASSDVENIKSIMSAKFPSFYKANEEMSLLTNRGRYDEETFNQKQQQLNKDFSQFESLQTENERRNYLNNKKKQEVDSKYANLSEKDKTSGAAITGEILKSLATPTTFIPAEKLIKGGLSGIKGVSKFAGISGLFGAEYSALDQYARTGTIDPVKLATDTGIAAASGGAFKVGVDELVIPVAKKTSELIQKSFKPKTKSLIKQSNDLVDELEFKIAEEVKLGTPKNDILPKIKTALGITDDELQDALVHTDRQIKVPNTVNQADQLIKTVQQRKNLNDYSPNNIFNKTIQPIYSRLEKIAPKIANLMRRFEFNIRNESNKYMQRVSPFLETIQKLPTSLQRQVSKNLFNGNFGQVNKILNAIDPQSTVGFNETVKVLREIRDKLQAGFKDMGEIPNYFPRKVKDLEGLYKAIGFSESSRIQKALKQYANKLQVTVKDLSDEEVALIVDKQLKGTYLKAGSSKPSFLKERKIQEIEDELLDFYENPLDALPEYIRGSVNKIETNNFFGKSSTLKGGMKTSIDIDKSAGNFMMDQLDELGIAADEVENLIKTRFNMGEQSPARAMQGVRNAIYSMTIANPESALVQVGDVGVTSYMNGFFNSMKALLGAKKVTMEDLGLTDLGAEYATTKGLTRGLNTLFKYSGFSRIDKLGKDTLLNSSLNAAKKLSQTEKGVNALYKKYGDVFGKDEFTKLISDFKNDRITDNVKYYLFHELSNVQPISLSEMPEYYLRYPNGRVLYALKSFTLKQLDLMRKTIYDQWQAGNKKTAVRNAGAYLMTVTLGNTGIDQVRKIMNGKEVNPEEVPIDFGANVIRAFGGSQYAWDRYLSKGQPIGFVTDMVMPPVDIVDNIGRDLFKLLEEEKSFSYSAKPKDYKSLKYIPIIGRALYTLVGGGKERAAYEERQKQKVNYNIY